MPINADHPFYKIRDMFTKDESFGVTVLAAATKLLTIEELQSYDPQAIRLELQELLRIPTIGVETFDKLMAALTVLSTDLFFNDVVSFNDLANILANSPTDADEYEPPTPLDMALAVYQATLIDPMDGSQDSPEFSEEVRMYMGAILAENGYIGVPPCLNMAIIPETYEMNAQSFMADAAFLPAMLDNTTALIAELEQEVATFKKIIDAQLQLVRDADIRDIVNPSN